MTLFDLILLLIVFGFVWFGFWYGLIHTLGGIISLILGVIFASRWYPAVALKILPIFGDNINLARLVAFIIIFIVARFIVFLLFRALNRVIDFLSFIPFLKTINRLAGAALGFIEGALIIGLILYFSTKFPLGANWIQLLANSNVAPLLIKFGNILLPLIPEAFKQIKSVV